MPSKLKTSRREHSSETIAVVLKLHSLGYSVTQISVLSNIPIVKSTVTSIIWQARLNPDQPYCKAYHTRHSSKLDACAVWWLIRFVDQNPFEILDSLSTLSKSGYHLHPNTTCKYLKKNEWYAFKPYCKPFLTKKHKACWLKFARKYIKWEDEDWDCVAFSDEATFELGLDTRPGSSSEGQGLWVTISKAYLQVGTFISWLLGGN